MAARSRTVCGVIGGTGRLNRCSARSGSMKAAITRPADEPPIGTPLPERQPVSMNSGPSRPNRYSDWSPSGTDSRTLWPVRLSRSRMTGVAAWHNVS